jgi:hypothetical protein
MVPACGTQQGTIEGQVLGIYSTSEQPKILSGASIQVSGSHGDQLPVLTGGDGKFKVTVPYDNFNVLANADGYQPRMKTVTVDSDKIETVGFVLVAPGIQQPDSPPPLTPQDRQMLSSGSFVPGSPGIGGGIFSDPFFWLWMFDRPYYFGYPRIPFVGYGGFGGGRSSVIVIDQRTSPLVVANQRGYTTYRNPTGPAVPGTKPAPAPQAVTSATGNKGAVRPSTGGSSGLTAPRGPAPIAPPSGSSINRSTTGSGSKGITSSGSSARPAPVAPPSSRGTMSRGGSKGRR